MRLAVRIPILLAGALLSTLVIFARPARADDAPSREYQVKAAMICNFLQFVEFPKTAFPADDAPLVIGVYGGNPFGNVLEQLIAGKSVTGHPLSIRYYSSIDAIGSCQVLFVPSSQDGDLPQVMKKVANAPVLTVGESDTFPWSGGVVRFYAEENKVRFEINPDAAESTGLKISSKLLKLARIFKR